MHSEYVRVFANTNLQLSFVFVWLNFKIFAIKDNNFVIVGIQDDIGKLLVTSLLQSSVPNHSILDRNIILLFLNPRRSNKIKIHIYNHTRARHARAS